MDKMMSIKQVLASAVGTAFEIAKMNENLTSLQATIL
jgi:hypothetical protein